MILTRNPPSNANSTQVLLASKALISAIASQLALGLNLPATMEQAATVLLK